MTRRQTRVAVDGEAWLINGVPTWRQREYRGWPIEGLLLNSRMANAVFDDANPATRFLWRYPDTGRWDADRNHRRIRARPAGVPRARPDGGDREPAGRGAVRLLPRGSVSGVARRAAG